MVLVPVTKVTETGKNFTNDLNSALTSLLDSVAPVSAKIRRSRKSTPWFQDKTHVLKQAYRKMECKWCKSKLKMSYLTWHEC